MTFTAEQQRAGEIVRALLTRPLRERKPFSLGRARCSGCQQVVAEAFDVKQEWRVLIVKEYRFAQDGPNGWYVDKDGEWKLPRARRLSGWVYIFFQGSPDEKVETACRCGRHTVNLQELARQE